MGTRKKGSELVFDLQWRNKPDGGGDKSNVIGMYDTPTTTSNFEMFKSYLLKNSGVAGNDVKVTYLTDSGQEWVIDSQDWFEIALSAFRLKARLGEIIFLKLDKISNGRHQITRKHSNDVETQFDIDSMDNNIVTPPEWFVTYMKQFKRDIVEEITYAVSSNSIGNSKEKENILLVKKSKVESSKRCRKHLVLGETPIDKEFLKTLKFDRKLESKLDKLDAKTKKIKEKKQALINKIESDEHRYLGKFSFIPMDDDEVKTSPVLDKQPVKEENNEISTNNVADGKAAQDSESDVSLAVDRALLNASVVNVASMNQIFTGGEVYLHTWEVINSGKLPWSSNTELRLTWGSADLVPSVKNLRCPSLKPGEQGSISVRFEIPETPGTYESNWNFYDNNVRFGRTLSLYVAVLASIRYITPRINTTEDSKILQKPEISSDLPEQKHCSESSTCIASNSSPKKFNFQVKTKGEIKVFPFGNSKPFCIPLPANAERILYFPNGIDGSKALDIPLNWDKKVEFVVPNASELKQKNCDDESEDDEENSDTVKTKIVYYPNGESEPLETLLKKSAEGPKIFYYPDEIENESKPLEFSLKKSAERAVPLLNISNNSTELKDVQSGALTAKQANEQCCADAVEEKSIDANNENSSELPPKQNNSQHFDGVEGFCVVGLEETTKEVELNLSVNDMSKRIENMNLTETSNADSDSDWESVWSYGKSKRIAPGCVNYVVGPSNKYGISESDLIVDLSTNAKVDSEKSQNVENSEKEDHTTIISNRNEDNNNNNGTLDNNNCSGESISEIASEVSSDLSSGYDVVQVPVFDEKEESSDYVYITIDGNKLSVPKHILRPDFLASFEQASTPTNSDEQKTVPTEVEAKKNLTEQNTAVQKLKSPITDSSQLVQEQNYQDKSLVTHCSASGSNFSDNNSGRLFIFPQHHPGYEVVDTANSNTEETAPVEGSQAEYSLANLETPCGINPPHLRNDPYGPLDQSQPTSERHPTPAPDQPTFERASPPTHPTYAYPAGFASCPTPEECGAQCRFPQGQRPYEFQHVPNYQQSMQQRRRRPMKTPSAPPQQPKMSENSTHGVPVHILPENLVSGAVNVASSAINTARSVINMIVPPKEPGRWVNGHWVTENPESLRAKNLCILAEMGFWDADLNATLLARYNDDITRVVSELVQ